jgi:hypothetical protein
MLLQCPDCRVPFVFEEETFGGLTQEQLRLIAGQIFGSWKFWAVLIVLVGSASWAVVTVADRVIDARAKQYLNTLEQNATNHIGAAFGQISNQIALEFRQPRIRNTIEQVARNRAGDILTNGVRPTLEAFQDALDSATSALQRSSNAIAKLEADALAAQRRIPPPAPVVPVTAPIAVVQTNVVAPPVVTTSQSPATPTAPPTVKLALANRTITQAGQHYILTLFFRATFVNGATSGMVDVAAGTYNQTAKILNFASMTSSPSEAASINAEADVARLRFGVSDRETPTLVIEFSGPTIVRLVSDSLDTDLTIPIAADKMPIAPVAK